MEDKDTQKNLNSNNQNSSVEQNSTGESLGAEKMETQKPAESEVGVTQNKMQTNVGAENLQNGGSLSEGSKPQTEAITNLMSENGNNLDTGTLKSDSNVGVVNETAPRESGTSNPMVGAGTGAVQGQVTNVSDTGAVNGSAVQNMVANSGVVNEGVPDSTTQNQMIGAVDGLKTGLGAENTEANMGSVEPLVNNGTEETTAETEPAEPKKSKFKFPGKMGTVAGPTATMAEIEKLENDASKQSKKKGKKEVEEEPAEDEKPAGENTDNTTEEEVEEEVIEEEVEEEVVDDEDTSESAESTAENATSNETAEENLTEQEAVADAKTKENAGAITGAFAETEEERNKRIEEDEKRKSKFVLFPKKTSGTGAVNGAGFDKEKIKDSNRSVRFRAGEPEQTEVDIENEIKKPKPLWLKITIAVVAVVISCGAIFGAYLGYLQSGHNRVYDWKYLQIVNKNKNNTVMLNTTLDCITYNMSYGIMDPDFTYFKAENKMANGSSTKGGSSRASSKDRVIINTNGSAELVGKGVNSSVDFILFQDIDVDSTRSFYVDQKEILANSLSTMAGVFAETGSSNYVFSPLSSPLGKTDSRMATFSDKYISFRIRYSLPSNSEFMTKYGTNDNCVILTRFKTAGSSMLSIINVNVGIYEDEEIRQKDLEALLKIMDYELNTKGNYCLVGGSFGYLLFGSEGEFLNNMQTPSWSKNLPDTFNADVLAGIGYSIARDEVAIDQNIGTVRDMSVAYNKGASYEAIVDGFIVSKNISVESTSVIDNGYLYSSHNPVKISFRLLK